MLKLFDSELKVMEILWKEGDQTAKQLIKQLQEQVGWSRTTTYTIIKKLVDKKAVQRLEPDFTCHAVISRTQAQNAEMDSLIDKMFDGSPALMMNALLHRKELSQEKIDELKKTVEDLR